jgi:hypothetical protein
MTRESGSALGQASVGNEQTVCREAGQVRWPRGVILGVTSHPLSHSGLFQAASASKKTLNLKGRNFRFE